MLDFVKIKYYLSPSILEIHSMQTISLAHISLSALMVFLPCIQVSASTKAPFTPKTQKQVSATINKAFPSGTKVRDALNKKPGFENNKNIASYFSDFSIKEAHDSLKATERFMALGTQQKQIAIWAKIEEYMTEKATAALQDIPEVEKSQINRLVGDLTYDAFMIEWEEANWKTIVGTQKASPSTDSNKKDSPKPGSTGGATDGTTPPPTGAGDGASTPNKTGKQSGTADVDAKKSSFTEYRKTIIGGVAFIGIAAWVYSKYSRIETQNSMNAGTAA